MFPTKSWSNYELVLKASGERQIVDLFENAFLVEMGLIDDSGLLTNIGSKFFEARFIKHDDDAANLVIRDALQTLRPVMAISQDLFGVHLANKESASSALRFRGIDQGLTPRSLGSLLTTMAKFEVIDYAKGSIFIIDTPMQKTELPQSVFISRDTPYSNTMWLTRLLKDADGYIHWIDKHFTSAAFEALWEMADGNRVPEIKILSLDIGTNSTKHTRTKYVNLKKELELRGIALEWRFIDSKLVRDTHDRWIIGKSKAWNVPDVGTIFSGNHSEMSRSNRHEDLETVFETYWDLGTEAFS